MVVEELASGAAFELEFSDRLIKFSRISLLEIHLCTFSDSSRGILTFASSTFDRP
jgi:hypothetical protein